MEWSASKNMNKYFFHSLTTSNNLHDHIFDLIKSFYEYEFNILLNKAIANDQDKLY